MASFFMVDTAGDDQLLGDKTVQPSYAIKDRLLIVDDKAESDDEDEEEPIEMEFFGVKLNSKDVGKAVASCNSESLTKPPSEVAVQLDELTEKVNEALQNSKKHKLKKRQRITDLKSGPDEILSVRKENVKEDMQKTRRIPGFEQLESLPTVSRRKQPILNRVSFQEYFPLDTFKHKWISYDDIFDS